MRNREQMRTLAVCILTMATIASAVWLSTVPMCVPESAINPVFDSWPSDWDNRSPTLLPEFAHLAGDAHPSHDEEIEAAFASESDVPWMASLSEAGDVREQYASKFRATRAKMKRERLSEGTFHCEACGCVERTCGSLEAHHVISVLRIVDERLPVSLIWDEKNLVFLCKAHHRSVGHDADGPQGPKKPNYKSSNPNVRADSAKMLKRLKPRM